MSSLEYAQRWCDALSNDTEAYADLYAPDQEFVIEKTMMDDHMNDTITFREDIVATFSDLANGDEGNGLGVHTFTPTKWTGDERYGLIEWDYKVEGLTSFRGIPNPEGKTLETNGSTFLQFGPDGKIVLESTCMNDNPIFVALGLPIMTPHYWDENFDPASLAG
jgi:steroid delta-isomerase-like uncharacterized protein